jgi:hypothetical protein
MSVPRRATDTPSLDKSLQLNPEAVRNQISGNGKWKS